MQKIFSKFLYLIALIFMSKRFITTSQCWQITEIPSFTSVLGQHLHWRYPNLYMADFCSSRVSRLDTLTNKVYSCQLANKTTVSFMIPQRSAEDLFIVGTGNNVVELQWDGVANECSIKRQLFEVEKDSDHICFFDGECDAKGRLFAGSGTCIGDMRLRNNHLFAFDDVRMSVIRNSLNMSNAMAWNYQRQEFYHIDSGANTITRFKYDIETGIASNPEEVFRPDEKEYPNSGERLVVLDSMALDSEGNLFVSLFGSGYILKISTITWTVLERFKFPCASLTAITFGGSKMDVLYVATTSYVPDNETFAEPCGRAYRLDGLDVHGVPDSTCVFD